MIADMTKPSDEHKFAVRTAPKLVSELHLAVVRNAHRKFRRRKLGIESLAAAAVSHFLRLPEDEQARILDAELPRIEAMFNGGEVGRGR